MYRVQAWQGLKLVRFHAKIGHTLKKIIIASTILENKVFWRNRAISKNVYNQSCCPDPIFSNENHVQKD